MCKQQQTCLQQPACLQPTCIPLSPSSVENVPPPRRRRSTTTASPSSSKHRRQWMTQSVVRRTAAQVENYLEALVDTTPFLQHPPATPVARLQRSELMLGDRVGTGGFSHVYAVQAIHLSADACTTPQQQTLRQYLADQVNHHGLQLAVKVLQSELLTSSSQNNNNKAFSRAACDLVAEAHYLERLQNEHQDNGIVRLAALPLGGVQAWKQNSTANHEDYFIVMERLDCTLAERLQDEWSSTATTTSANTANQVRLLQQYMLPVAKTLQYLHSHRLVFRDLKPQNIGIARDGRVVLLDFGLCRQLPATTTSSTTNEVFAMSGVGTRRYMAPETLSLLSPSHRYNQQVDVYSWTMIAWQVLTGCRPYMRYGTMDHVDAVVTRRERPRLLPGWPNALQTLLANGWHHDPTVRWTSTTLVQAVERYCAGSSCGMPEPPLSPTSVTTGVRSHSRAATSRRKSTIQSMDDVNTETSSCSANNKSVESLPTLVMLG